MPQNKPESNGQTEAPEPGPDPAKTRPESPTPPPEGQKEPTPFPVVGMGASAGGLDALKQFFSHMPADSGMAFVVIVHLPPDHHSHLPQLLEKQSEMPVREIQNGLRAEPNTAYIIAPDRYVAILNGRLHLMETDVPHRQRAPIDYFFRSLAQDQDERAIGIILSGMGTNGTVGMRAIKEVGGMIMAQTPDSAAYDSMPRSAIDTNMVDYTLAPADMPRHLMAYVEDYRVKLVEPSPPLAGADPDDLQKLFLILRDQTGHDFSEYKESSVKRRVSRRMAVQNVDRLADYVRFLTSSPGEVEALFKELLIGVTNFFRDPEAFEIVRKRVLPVLLENRDPKVSLRVWVPGCSTGEEAYSLAIILREYMNENNLHVPVQIFATDIDAEAIEAARWGAYPDGIVVDISPERLGRYFSPQDGRYRIIHEIREMVVFAVQSVIQDPPFSRVDLISCRNLLIYMNQPLQQKVLRLFHYSLKAKGFLLLGTSESVGQTEDLFRTFDKKWRLFRPKSEVSAQLPKVEPIELSGRGEVKSTANRRAEIRRREGSALARQALLERHTPAAVLVDEDGAVVYFHGDTDPYLRPPQGERPFNILSMARPGLEIELRAGLRRAGRDREKVEFDGLRVQNNGRETPLKLIIEPLSGDGSDLLLILFQPIGAPAPAGNSAPAEEDTDVKDKSRQELERELSKAKRRLQATIEELEISNEDVRSANEELQSANEELQSINEELQTSQEELQSANEELATTNTDYQQQIDELKRSSETMQNLLANIQVSTIFLDTHLCIQFFTPGAREIFNLIRPDVGRPLADLDSKLLYDHLIEDAQEVLDTLCSREMEIHTKDGRLYRTHILPYRTDQEVIDGVVITFLDVTELRGKEVQVRQLDIMNSIVDTIREPLVLLDAELRIVVANRSFHEWFGLNAEEMLDRYIYELRDGEWDIPELRRLLEQIIPRDNSFEDLRIEQDFEGLGQRAMSLNARRLHNQEGYPQFILLAIQDVTGQQEEAEG